MPRRSSIVANGMLAACVLGMMMPSRRGVRTFRERPTTTREKQAKNRYRRNKGKP